MLCYTLLLLPPIDQLGLPEFSISKGHVADLRLALPCVITQMGSPDSVTGKDINTTTLTTHLA